MIWVVCKNPLVSYLPVVKGHVFRWTLLTSLLWQLFLFILIVDFTSVVCISWTLLDDLNYLPSLDLYRFTNCFTKLGTNFVLQTAAFKHRHKHIRRRNMAFACNHFRVCYFKSDIDRPANFLLFEWKDNNYSYFCTLLFSVRCMRREGCFIFTIYLLLFAFWFDAFEVSIITNNVLFYPGFLCTIDW